MRGSAGFALDDGEDDVYSTDFKSGYDFQLGGHNNLITGVRMRAANMHVCVGVRVYGQQQFQR